MESLNIPLTNKQTARLSWRAVWQWGSILMLCVAVWSLVRLGSTRLSFPSIAPSDAIVSIHLKPTHRSWQGILSLFGDAGVGESALSLRDIAPYVRSEMALYVRKRGKILFVFKGNVPNDVRDTWVNYGVSVREENGVTYVGEGVLEPTQRDRPAVLHRLLPTFIGYAYVQSEFSPLLGGAKTFEVLLPSIRTRSGDFSLSKADFRAPFGPETFGWVSAAIDSAFLERTGGENLTNILTQLSRDGGDFAIFGEDVVLFFHQSIPEALFQKLARFSINSSNPVIQSHVLPDGTTVREIGLKEDHTLEEELIGEWGVLSKGGTTLARRLNGVGTIIASRRDALLDVLASQNETEKHDKSCGAKGSVLSGPLRILTTFLMRSQTTHTKTYILESLFVNTGLDKTLFGSKVVFCRE